MFEKEKKILPLNNSNIIETKISGVRDQMKKKMFQNINR